MTKVYPQLHTNFFQEYTAGLTPLTYRACAGTRLPRQAAYAQLTGPRHDYYATGEAQLNNTINITLKY